MQLQRRPHLCDYLLNLELAEVAKKAVAAGSGGRLPAEPWRLATAEEEAKLGETHQTGGPEAALAELTTRVELEAGAGRIVDVTDEPEGEEDAEEEQRSPPSEQAAAAAAAAAAEETPAMKLKLIQALLAEYAMVAEPRAEYDSRLAQRAERWVLARQQPQPLCG